MREHTYNNNLIYIILIKIKYASKHLDIPTHS